MAKPTEVTDADFDQKVLKASTPVVVDFWAPWCGPCRQVAPILDELAGEYAEKVSIVKVNTDDNQQYAAQLGIQGIPTLIIFKDGQEVDRMVGAMRKPNYKAHIDAVLEAK